MIKAKHRIFLDTNFFLDIIRDRKEESKLLLEKIKRSEWYCCTSSFAVCELVDKEQEFTYALNLLTKEKRSIDEILRIRREKNITQTEREETIRKVRAFFAENRIIRSHRIRDEGWDNALRILRDQSISACDSIHIATAIETGCSVFITSDKGLGKAAKAEGIIWMSPEEAVQKL